MVGMVGMIGGSSAEARRSLGLGADGDGDNDDQNGYDRGGDEDGEQESWR